MMIIETLLGPMVRYILTKTNSNDIDDDLDVQLDNNSFTNSNLPANQES